ncbi:hypothetical protein C2W64_01506 [Brevibacillus laterosporus]|nr:hypothetical protein [Brevibacillus laterosporus]RAP26550.1 hypothetical protein C2W64_01506 [Brevibacillus laterosporus]
MRKISIPLLSMTLFTSIIGGTSFSYAASKENNSTMSQNVSEDNEEEIHKKLTEIADKYKIGEPIKGEDLEYIKKYSIKVESNQNPIKAQAIWAIGKVCKLIDYNRNGYLSANLTWQVTPVIGLWQILLRK